MTAAAFLAAALLLAADPPADEPAAGEDRGWKTNVEGSSDEELVPLDERPVVTGLRPLLVIREFLYEGPFKRVAAVFCDPRNGEIYAVDSGQGVIGIWDARGAPLFAFSDDEHLSDPQLVQVDRAGQIYVGDGDRSRIKVFNYRGEYQSSIDVAAIARREVTITAFALDGDDNPYVGDSTRGEILVLNHRCELRERFGSFGTGNGEFTSIASIYVDADHIYVADQVGLGVQVFSRHGRFQLGFGVHEIGKKNVSLPAGIGADPKGRILLADTLRHEIKYFEADGQLIDIFGGIGQAPGDVAYPVDLSIGRDGVICVADKGNRRIQVLETVEAEPDFAKGVRIRRPRPRVETPQAKALP